MNEFKIKLTAVGKAALVNSDNTGTNALAITAIEVGSDFYAPNGSESNLKALVKTMPAFGGEVVGSDVIHISLRDESNESYDVGEIGLRTGDGVLFGVISSEDGLITTKGVNDVLLIAADIAITEADVSSITFGEANFIYRPGTEEDAGIFELATDIEVDAKAVGKVIDAEKFQDGITRRSSSAINSEDTKRLATSKAIHSLAAVIAANQATTNASLSAINAIIQSDTADLDTLQEIAEIITSVKNTQDTLAIGNIADLQTALNGKTNTGHNHVITDITNLAVTINSLTIAINAKAANNHTHSYSPIGHGHTTVISIAANNFSTGTVSKNLADGFYMIELKGPYASQTIPLIVTGTQRIEHTYELGDANHMLTYMPSTNLFELRNARQPQPLINNQFISIGKIIKLG